MALNFLSQDEEKFLLSRSRVTAEFWDASAANCNLARFKSMPQINFAMGSCEVELRSDVSLNIWFQFDKIWLDSMLWFADRFFAESVFLG